MKSKKIYCYALLGLVFFNMFLSITPLSVSQDEDVVTYGKEFKETMICEDDKVITDEQWQWWKCVVTLGEKVIVELEYEGDLDLDLKLYWKRENFPQFNGFDLSHCDIDTFTYSDNSQLRTTDTDEIGEVDELYFTNPSYTKVEDQEAFILVYVHDGEGVSKFTLTSSSDLSRIADEEVWHCIPSAIILIGYLLGAAVIFLVYVFIILKKKAKITRPEKEKKIAKATKKLETIDLDTKIGEYKDYKKDKKR